MELTHTAGRPGRLSSFLRGEMGLSEGLMNRLKRQERLLVNGVARFTNYPVEPGDVITAVLDEPAPVYPAEDGPLSVLYEDAHILAVDKPAGMLIHPSRTKMEGTLANLVAGYYRRTGQNCIFHPVTRLDRDTYGIVLLAKNTYVHANANRLHAEGRLRKTYHALALGGPEADSGTVDAPIARIGYPSLMRQVREDGKPSVTEFQVLARGTNWCKLALRPVTGRTHQLRVHCAYMGCPILGDPQYGSAASQAFSERLGLTGQALCAKALEFPHPVTGEQMRLESRLDIPQAPL